MTTKAEGTPEEDTMSSMEEGFSPSPSTTFGLHHCCSNRVATLAQKVVNKIYGSVTFPGICVTWGLIVMVMIYTVGHISGAHFNPAVTITLAIFRRFSYKQVPLYIFAQLLGSILASGTLALMLDVTPKSFFGTIPVGSNVQSLAAETIITFLLMFVISAVTTDDRAVGDFAGVVVGMTIMLNVFVAGPVSGASMNPARSIGPSLMIHVYKGLWIYIVGPIIGAIAGALAYNFLRSTTHNSPSEEITGPSSGFEFISHL
ncbi:hypothetical protein V8G54_037838 [Vigna mungo]|uniref:Aquaporin NIP-type n=1 Tax=Vigna mungo TaxID=3915 RepID=A0AAQ3ML26_VIGMU